MILFIWTYIFQITVLILTITDLLCLILLKYFEKVSEDFTIVEFTYHVYLISWVVGLWIHGIRPIDFTQRSP